jgi:hypothetical protein
MSASSEVLYFAISLVSNVPLYMVPIGADSFTRIVIESILDLIKASSSKSV